MKKLIVLLLLAASPCYADIIAEQIILDNPGRLLNLDVLNFRAGPVGEVEIDLPTGKVVCRNVNYEIAAKEFWVQMELRFPEIKVGKGQLAPTHVQLTFKGGQKILVDCKKGKIRWPKAVPDKASRLFWDAVVLAFEKE